MSADIDAELVYHVVKWLHENWDVYKHNYHRCMDMTIDTVKFLIENEYIPVHEGTVRYLKEIGEWTEAYETLQQAKLRQLTVWIEAYQTAIKTADEQGIKIDPTNELWMKHWEKTKKAAGLTEFIVVAAEILKHYGK